MNRSATAEGLRHLKRRLWRVVGERPDGELPRSVFNRFFAFLIVFSVVFAVVATEGNPGTVLVNRLRAIDLSISLLFLVEYLLRLWVSPLSGLYGRGWRAYGRYLRSPFALVDLVALLPLFVDVIGSELYMVRLFRLLRVLRLSRSRRFREAVFRFGYALRAKRSELEVALVFTGSVILVSATGLYMSEGSVQPEHFGSIPRALWWAVCTVTTVGYGDVVPVTVVGRLLGGLTALAGIGSIAIPTGILVVGFGEAAEALEKRRPGNQTKRKHSQRARRRGPS